MSSLNHFFGDVNWNNQEQLINSLIEKIKEKYRDVTLENFDNRFEVIKDFVSFTNSINDLMKEHLTNQDRVVVWKHIKNVVLFDDFQVEEASKAIIIFYIIITCDDMVVDERTCKIFQAPIIECFNKLLAGKNYDFQEEKLRSHMCYWAMLSSIYFVKIEYYKSNDFIELFSKVLFALALYHKNEKDTSKREFIAKRCQEIIQVNNLNENSDVCNKYQKAINIVGCNDI